MSSFKPSKYQQDIFDHLKTSSKNGVVEAVAGSGKSTTLIESMKVSNKRDPIFIAFNKHIVEEMKSRVPDNIKVTTMHSFGLEQIRRVYRNVKIDVNKVKRAVKVLSPMWDTPKNVNKLEWLERIVALSNLLRLTLNRDPENGKFVAQKHSIPYTLNEVEYALDVIKSLDRNRDTIDFIDMVYIPAIEDIRISEHSLVLVDECQDLSAAQIGLLSKIKTPTGQTLAVGDRRQAIYGFGGADDESFSKLISMANTKLLPLSICYRCSKSVIEHAKQFVPQIEFCDTAIDGRVEIDGSVAGIQDGDMVLCRTTAPLIRLALQLIKEGRKATIIGVDISEKIMTTIKNTNCESLTGVVDILWNRYNEELENYERSGGSMNIVNYLKDMAETVQELANNKTTISEISELLNSIFSDTSDSGIELMTIHKSKGLESKNVHILRPDLLPHKNAKLPWEIEQEQNLHYVAITRAKENLSYVRDFM